MKAKQIGFCVLFLGLCLALALYVTPAQARDGVFSNPESGSDAAFDKAMLPVLQPALAPNRLPGKFATCNAGVSGDGNLLKIHSGYATQPVIYMQCGRVVAKVGVGAAGCGCNAGGWRYVNDCVKSAPVYVTLPCPGR